MSEQLWSLKIFALFFSLTLILPVVAGTHRVPNDEPIATLQLPDKWSVREVGEALEAVSGDGTAHILVAPVEGSKVAESLGEAIRYVRNTNGIVLKSDSQKKEKVQVKDKQLESVSWDGREKERDINLRCYVVPGAEGKRLVALFWGSPEAQKKHDRELRSILESINPP